mmetsp:Transcript_89607/g.159080  ORF Transcript_89607/g.159080 Transcript_89607/m.159080 type:complete len:262 (+) Transcript_89607:62-847(+)
MGFLRNLNHRIHENWLLASALMISGVIAARMLTQKKHESTPALALATALGLKPAFAKRLAELAAFKDRLGHVDVPLGSATGSKLVPNGLGRWVYTQRKRKIDGKMQAAEEAALTALGFRWKLDPEELDFEEMVERLVAYRQKHGDTLVPKKCEADPLLGAWVAAMRRKADPLLNGGETALDAGQRERLETVGFSWEPARRCGSNFMTGFRAWADAKQAGMPVPDEAWCELQREARRQGKLSEQRIAYLDKFEFEWKSGEHV